MSEEHKEKIRVANLGRAPSEATREKMRQAKLGVRNWAHLNHLHASNTGKKRSAEARENMRKAQRRLQQLAIDKTSKQRMCL